MQKKPLVSILIASYNKERYVKRCINSCKIQTYDNIEIIFYDDGSEDNSYQIAKNIKVGPSFSVVICTFFNDSFGARPESTPPQLRAHR